MDGVRYWMGTKSLNPRVFPTDSWEEQAFAEDAGGALGGCVWPPRSYSCSFCRRDFRSAQALGGHMNVHRRDRARLKQSPAAELVPQNHALNGCTSLDSPYSTQMCTFLFGNPNPQFIRVSSPPPKEENLSSDLRFFSTRGDKGSLVSSDPLSWSSFLSGKRDRDLDEVIENGEKKYAVAVLESRVEKEDCITEDLSMSLNLWRTDTCKDEEVASCKRRRIEAKPLGFLPKLKVCSSSPADDLDLELRLGDAPKMQRDLQFLGEYHDYFSLMNSYKI